MKRKDFYIEYYRRTDRKFSDKIVWTKEDREDAWRRGQLPISKFGRKIRIAEQYLLPLGFGILVCFHPDAWPSLLIAVILLVLGSMYTEFSLIQVECLYALYRRKTVYAALLHEIFLGRYDDFLDELQRVTKKVTTGYVFLRGGKLCGKFAAVCRDKNRKVFLTFRSNRVVLVVNGKKTIVNRAVQTRDALWDELAAVLCAEIG